MQWGLRPHASRLVKIVPTADVQWTSEEGEARAWRCPAWGCQIQDTVRRQWGERMQ